MKYLVANFVFIFCILIESAEHVKEPMCGNVDFTEESNETGKQNVN